MYLLFLRVPCIYITFYLFVGWYLRYFTHKRFQESSSKNVENVSTPIFSEIIERKLPMNAKALTIDSDDKQNGLKFQFNYDTRTSDYKLLKERLSKMKLVKKKTGFDINQFEMDPNMDINRKFLSSRVNDNTNVDNRFGISLQNKHAYNIDQNAGYGYDYENHRLGNKNQQYERTNTIGQNDQHLYTFSDRFINNLEKYQQLLEEWDKVIKEDEHNSHNIERGGEKKITKKASTKKNENITKNKPKTTATRKKRLKHVKTEESWEELESHAGEEFQEVLDFVAHREKT